MPAIRERLEARISREQKQLLHEAAQLRGQSLTAFVVSSAQEAARRTLEERIPYSSRGATARCSPAPSWTRPRQAQRSIEP
jgi:hypothetical protein